MPVPAPIAPPNVGPDAPNPAPAVRARAAAPMPIGDGDPTGPAPIASMAPNPRAAALGGRSFQPDSVSPVVAGGRELDRLLPPQPELRLEAQRHRDMRVLHQGELLRVEHLALVLVGHVLAVDDAEFPVRGHCARFPDPVPPPADVRGAVLHRADGPTLALPLAHQRHRVLASQPGGPQALEAQLVQRVRRLGEDVGARRARAVGAVVVRRLQALQVEVQVAHRNLPGGAPVMEGNLKERKGMASSPRWVYDLPR